MNKKKSLVLIIGLVMLTTPIQADTQSEKEKKEHKEHKGGSPAGEQHGKLGQGQVGAGQNAAPSMQIKPLPTQAPATKSPMKASATPQSATPTPQAQHPAQPTQVPTTGGGLLAPVRAAPIVAPAPKQNFVQNISDQLTKLTATTKQQMDDFSKLDQASLGKKRTELMQEHVNKGADLDQAYTELKRLSQTTEDVAKNSDAIQIQLNRIILDASQLVSIKTLMQ